MAHYLRLYILASTSKYSKSGLILNYAHMAEFQMTICLTCFAIFGSWSQDFNSSVYGEGRHIAGWGGRGYRA